MSILGPSRPDIPRSRWKSRIFGLAAIWEMLYFTEVLSHYGKNPAPTKEVIPWEKQPYFSTAGYAPIPAFIADRHLWRVPNQPAEPSPGQPLLFGGGRDLAQKERAAADLLPRQAPGLSAGGKSQGRPAGRLAGAFLSLPDRRHRHQPPQERGEPAAPAPPPCGNLYHNGQCGGRALSG